MKFVFWILLNRKLSILTRNLIGFPVGGEYGSALGIC